ncbi:MAG TPA: class I SAM-dependent methyltransferase [Pirellulales bacterium]|nr:class I SAM-dependent methyltransferase [Pirellulales bacterium]
MLRRLRDIRDHVVRRLPGKPGEALRLGLYASSHIVPAAPSVRDDQAWVPVGEIGCQGIDLHERDQLEQLDRWKAAPFKEMFSLLRNDPAINTQRLGQSSLTNGWYNTPDAEVYAAMIQERQPRRIVEVGAGFSTLIARAAVRHAGLQTQITVVDPAPRTDVMQSADECLRLPVERSRLTERDWARGDVLFIDSSHVCRTRGDLPYLYCQLIPRLPPGVLIHVHDVYLPYDYPNNVDHLCYTEQYLLHALLSHSPRYRTAFACHWLSRRHPHAMREVFGAETASDARLYGGCYWFEVI